MRVNKAILKNEKHFLKDKGLTAKLSCVKIHKEIQDHTWLVLFPGGTKAHRWVVEVQGGSWERSMRLQAPFSVTLGQDPLFLTSR